MDAKILLKPLAVVPALAEVLSICRLWGHDETVLLRFADGNLRARLSFPEYRHATLPMGLPDPNCAIYYCFKK